MSPAPPRVAACEVCLRRTALIASVAGAIEITWRQATGPAQLLGLPDGALRALDPAGAAAALARFDATAARERIAAAGLVARCRHTRDYPARLHDLDDPPAVLHVRGDLAALQRPEGVAVVGARRASEYGLEVARSLGRGIAAAGLPVVSGLALGIDAAAHVGAVAAARAAEAPPGGPIVAEWPEAPPGGPIVAEWPEAPPGGPIVAARPDAPPVAVLAGAAELPYPARHRGLHARVAALGAVVSEMPPGFVAHRWCFPARNRLIAALSAVTVVVEAAGRSGSLITADLAADLGRTVAAVPGRVTAPQAQGTNELLHEGAALVRDARDVLDLVHDAGFDAGTYPAELPEALPPSLARVLAAVADGRGHLGALARTPAEAEACLRALTELEARGLVRRGFGGRYVPACP